MAYGRRKYQDLSQKNENLISSFKKIQLYNLRKKYGWVPLNIPHLLYDFGFDQAKIDEIEIFNQNIKLKNQEIHTKIQRQNEKRTVLIHSFLSLLFFPFAILLIWILFISGWGQLIPFVALVLISIFINREDFLGNFVSKKYNYNLLPLHKLSDDLEEYKQAVADNILFVQLLEDERKDKIERSKREFWFSLNGFEFENQVAKLFRKNGYKADVTKRTGDGGIDINLYDENDFRTIVQCKAHKKPIGPHEARAIYGLMSSENAQKAILVSLGGFTQGVKDFVKEKNIILMDIEDVMRLG